MKTTTRRIVDLLWCPDETNTSIGRKSGKHRDTIRKFRANMNVSGLSKVELDALDDAELEATIIAPKKIRSRFCEPDFAQIIADLKRKPGKTIEILHQEYVADILELNDPTKTAMSLSRFYQRVREYRKQREPEFRHAHLAGGALQFDFSGKRPYYMDGNGDAVFVELAIAVLPYSGLTFAIATATQSLSDSIEALVKSLEYFGGVPENAVFDNFKAAVDRPRRGSVPAKMNASFLACLDHYSLFPDPARG